MNRSMIAMAIANFFLTGNSPQRFGRPIPMSHLRKQVKPGATRDRKNTGSGVIKAKRAAAKRRNKARH